ncbi:MAG: 4-alpha-glucanotransferase [Clostridia bacterium]|nr:4-alpha-glucanotransferase [Clostridia bacterium]
MKDCGVLLHISSLPSPYGIGDLGETAYAFADFLAGAGQSYWQVLPVGPTSYGDSPYQSPSAFAGNPYFIDLAALKKEGLLTETEEREARMPSGDVDYGRIFTHRVPLLRKAYERFTEKNNPDYVEFCRKNAYWLDSYALFQTIKEKFSLCPHWEWESAYRNPHTDEVVAFARTHTADMDFVRFLQYTFDKQWRKWKQYVNSLGIKIIGDAPIYAAYDSADFWECPQCFAVDDQGKVTDVAGVPPDYFSADGQLWGNPLYDWDYLRAHDYDFWVNRVRRSFELFDLLRIDHFRGFCAYYSIAAGSTTAREGEWKEGPGKDLFDAIESALGKTDIIAEDLGVDSPELRELLRDCGYPGMKVVQFGFDGSAAANAHAVRNFTENCIGYTGTHDNDTFLGWYTSLPANMRKRVRSRLKSTGREIPLAAIRALYASRVRTAIVPMQDWLRQGSEARMNVPGTPSGNWRYRLIRIPDSRLQGEMLTMANEYGRERTDE